LTWLSVITGLLKLANALADYAGRRQLIQVGVAEAARVPSGNLPGASASGRSNQLGKSLAHAVETDSRDLGNLSGGFGVRMAGDCVQASVHGLERLRACQDSIAD